MNAHETLWQILKEAKKAGVPSVAAGYRRVHKRMVRFSNNSITVTNSWTSETPTIYLVSEKRRAACVVEEQNLHSLSEAIDELARTMKFTPPGDVAFRLPQGPFKYQPVEGTYDNKVAHAETELIDAVETTVNAAKREGATRVSGVVTVRTLERYVLTSEGCDGSDRGTEIGLTVRGFASDDASGQGISVATNLRDFNPEEAGRAAGRIATMALNPQAGQAGRYAVVFGPSILANILERIVDSTSAYALELGLSFFQGRLKQHVGSEMVNLTDNGRLASSPGATCLDDEGYPTQENKMIVHGVLESYLQTAYTAAKHKAALTGSAEFEASFGAMVPSAHNIALAGGDGSVDELLDKAHDGLYVTNNWYTRFQNYRTGDFSTILRDGVFRIANGKIAGPLKGLRLSDNMIRMLQSVKALSKTRQWIKWWEVNTPTLTPYALIDGVGITTASK